MAEEPTLPRPEAVYAHSVAKPVERRGRGLTLAGVPRAGPARPPDPDG